MKIRADKEQQKTEKEENARTFAMLASHYDPGWRQRWAKEAEKWQDKIPEAKEFLQKVCR